MLILVAALTLFLVSCDNEPARPPSEDIREEIAGDWYCELNDGDSTMPFEVTITLDPDNENQILISNFHSTGVEAYAIVYEDNTIELPAQDLGVSGTSVKRSTNIVISDGFDRIDWEYEATDQTGTYTAIVTFILGDISK